ncbi:MAG: hypothetical protein GY719_38005 [bacterium]|nr:hypothetical protein [bacterium]
MYLKKAGRGLQLTDGERTAKPSRLHRKSSMANLEQRFEEKYAAYRARVPQKRPLAAARASVGQEVPGGREIAQERVARPARGRDFEASLEQLKEELAKLERWDEIERQRKELADTRPDDLRGGSYYLPQYDRSIERAENVQRHVGDHFEEIFRDPEAARTALEQSYADVGRVATYRRLAMRPEEFGKLHGQQIFGRVTEAREKALERAHSLGQGALKSMEEERRLRERQEQVERYLRQQRGLQEELKKFGKDRDELVAGVGRQAEGLELGELKRHLKPQQYEQLKDIRRGEEKLLKPLRESIKRFDAARAAGRRGLRFAKTVAGLYGVAPRQIVMRLLPAEVRVAVAAVELVRSVAKTLGRGMSM